MKKSLFVVTALFLLAGTTLSAQAKILLAKKGKTNFSVVLPANPTPAQKRAGEELAKYAALAASAPQAKVGTAPVQGLIPVRLVISKEKFPMADSYRLQCDKNGITISGGNDQALFHGVYRLLVKYAGMRWIAPGKDGEYYIPGKTIEIPVQNKVDSPAFPCRGLELNCANTNGVMTNTWDWMLRNHYHLSSYYGAVHSTKAWMPQLGIELRARGASTTEGRMFCGALTGERIRPDVRSEADELKKLYETHKEIFPLVNGKRIMMRGLEQPCTTNAETVSRTSGNVELLAKRLADVGGGRLSVINQDGTTWCSCPACLAADPAGEKKQHYCSTRYWTFLNQIFASTMKKYPNVSCWGLAYQNFQTVPEGVKIDPRINAGLSFNRRCFRHELNDPKCPTNREFLKYYQAWGKLPNLTYSREEFHAGVGKNFMFSEKQLINGFRIYKKTGIDGAHICTVPADGVYRPFYTDIVKQGWYAEWQALYLAGAALWDLNINEDAMLEEANALYYGAGWKNGMKEFRTILTKAHKEAEGCFGWGHGTPAGRALAKAGMLDRLYALLNKAEKAAAKDPRALAHIKREHHLFDISIAASTREFLRSYKELKSHTAEGPVKIDGKADEPGWKKAQSYSGFPVFDPGNIDKSGKIKLAKYQTFVRTMYDKNNIYLFIEAMEPDPGRIITEGRISNSPWSYDSLEIFLSHPNFNGGYYHFAFTRKGSLYQAQTQPGSMKADTSVKTDIEIKSLSLPDRWCAEVRIPAGKIGQTFDDGHTWQLNIARSRKHKDGREQSSLANGFHGVFLPVALSGKYQTGKEGAKDSSLWKNGNFNDNFKKPNDKWAVGWNLGKENLLPRGWGLNTSWKGGSVFEMLKHPGSPNDYYVHLKNGNFYQRHDGLDKAMKYTFRAKGKGTLSIMIFRYGRGKLPNASTVTIRTLKLNSDQWEKFEGIYVKRAPEERPALVFWADNTGDFYIDDAYFFGCEVPKNTAPAKK